MRSSPRPVLPLTPTGRCFPTLGSSAIFSEEVSATRRCGAKRMCAAERAVSAAAFALEALTRFHLRSFTLPRAVWRSHVALLTAEQSHAPDSVSSMNGPAWGAASGLALNGRACRRCPQDRRPTYSLPIFTQRLSKLFISHGLRMPTPPHEVEREPGGEDSEGRTLQPAPPS